MPVVSLNDVRFRWQARLPLTLDITHFEIDDCERVFLYGPSGSGKSTLLNLLGGVLKPEQGIVACLNHDLVKLGNRACDQFRADHIGMIFQQFNLVPYLSVLENVMLPCHFSERRRKHAEAAGSTLTEAQRLLKQLGLVPDLWLRAVTQLSVGQQQRVAAARALIGMPELIIADEPTSSLDADHRGRFLEILLEQSSAQGSALLFVSHDLGLMSHFTRSLSMVELNRAALKEAA